MTLQFVDACNSKAGILFWFDVIFWVSKTRDQVHFTFGTNTIPEEPCLTVIKLSIYPLCWEHSLVENTLSFPDLTLIYLLWELSLEYLYVIWQRNENPVRKQTIVSLNFEKKVRFFNANRLIRVYKRNYFMKYIGTNAYG